jgi:hypothetical protein
MITLGSSRKDICFFQERMVRTMAFLALVVFPIEQ